jgi:choline dehydrogenase
MTHKDRALRHAIDRYRRGACTRREFLAQATALGLTAGVAGALATIHSNDAFAQSSKTTDTLDGSFDYIVVGSGSAGATLAYRLATRTDARVLVLEAGGADDVPEIHDPRQWAAALGTRATKFFETTAQPHTANRKHQWPRGNVLGGTSCLNAMIFARGHRGDFDSWAYAGCTGWDYANVLRHFKEFEDFEGGADEYRGTGGPLHVSMPRGEKRHPGAQMFMQASVALGYKETPDFNGATMEGPAWVNMTVRDLRRQSTAVAFLKPALARPNLKVLTEAPVLKLLFEGKRCVGVQYLHGGRPRTVRAAREVIVSAGAIDSPRLLLLSGIGPRAELTALGIPLVHNLPGVGRNLQDHVLGAGPNYESPVPIPISNYNHSEVYMWAKSDARVVAPDLITLYVSVPFSTAALPMKGVKNGWCLLSGVARPTSTGWLRLRSADPKVAPLVNPNYLATDHDRHAFSKATELARETALHAAFAPHRAREVLPGPAVKVGTPAWREFLAKSAHTYFHPTSTCKMGVDEMAVVDPQLRVYGVEGLRVADASIMPNITTSNTNAPSIMIGWRAAELIRGAEA